MKDYSIADLLAILNYVDSQTTARFSPVYAPTEEGKIKREQRISRLFELRKEAQAELNLRLNINEL